MPYTHSSDGVSLWYEEHGNTNGIPVIFSHGFAFDSSMWSKQLPLFAHDCAFRIIFYDMRAHGKSSAGSAHLNISKLTQMEDLLAVYTACHVEKAILLGHSMVRQLPSVLFLIFFLRLLVKRHRTCLLISSIFVFVYYAFAFGWTAVSIMLPALCEFSQLVAWSWPYTWFNYEIMLLSTRIGWTRQLVVRTAAPRSCHRVCFVRNWPRIWQR